MTRYTSHVIRIVSLAAFLALVVFNVDVVGPEGLQATASSDTAECDLCLGNAEYCATYCFPDDDTIWDCYIENTDNPIVIIAE